MAENTVPEKTHLASPGQTVGPFFAFGLDYPKKHEVVFPHSPGDRKSTRLNSSHNGQSRMPSSA